LSLIRVGVDASNFAEAITAAGELLVEAGHVKPEYVSAMVRVVEELGPYIVIAEGIALAHASPGDLVSKNSISLVVLENAVDFGSGKMVKAVFAMAATDHSAHIDALGELATLLSDEEFLNTVLNASDTTQIASRLTLVLGE
jgi:PTS system ascorbate-specific IIA component